MSVYPYSILVFSIRSYHALPGRSLAVSARTSDRRGAAARVGPLRRPMNRVTPTALTLIIATMAGFSQASESKTIVSGDTIFISGCCAAAWTCWTRGSFGLLANYVFLIIIDIVGLIRMLTH